MKKLSKVVMLPTEKATNILLTGRNDLVYITKDFGFVDNIDRFQHLYFLSDEEIKEGDWVMSNTPLCPRYFEQATKEELERIAGNWKNGTDKKIIATTDESLGLPRPSNEFIKKYCELGGIDEVMVQYEDYLINPLTEQEVSITDTIAAEDLDIGHKLKVAPDNTITIYPVKK